MGERYGVVVDDAQPRGSRAQVLVRQDAIRGVNRGRFAVRQHHRVDEDAGSTGTGCQLRWRIGLTPWNRPQSTQETSAGCLDDES